VGCEEDYYRQPAKELGEALPRGIEARFIPAQKWRHLWPSAVAGWAGDGSAIIWPWRPQPLRWTISEIPRIPHPRLLFMSRRPKRNAGKLLYLGYRIRCATLDHALPNSVVYGPHSTWPWMAVPRWVPDGVNYVENRTIQAIDEFFKKVVRRELNRAPIFGDLRRETTEQQFKKVVPQVPDLGVSLPGGLRERRAATSLPNAPPPVAAKKFGDFGEESTANQYCSAIADYLAGKITYEECRYLMGLRQVLASRENELLGVFVKKSGGGANML